MTFLFIGLVVVSIGLNVMAVCFGIAALLQKGAK